MELENYKDIIKKTAIYPDKVENFGKMYVLLGLWGEYNEFKNSVKLFEYSNGDLRNIIKESGDVIWYITAGALEYNLDLNDIFKKALFYVDIGQESPDVLIEDDITDPSIFEVMKKYFRDNKEIISEFIEMEFVNHLGMVLSILDFYDIDLDKVLEENYNKLIKRRDTNTLHGDGDNREEVN